MVKYEIVHKQIYKILSLNIVDLTITIQGEIPIPLISMFPSN